MPKLHAKCNRLGHVVGRAGCLPVYVLLNDRSKAHIGKYNLSCGSPNNSLSSLAVVLCSVGGARDSMPPAANCRPPRPSEHRFHVALMLRGAADVAPLN